MNRTDVLNNLQQRNNALKSKLLHEQIRYGNYSFRYFQKYSSIIVNEYRKRKSLYGACLNAGIDYNDVINWYVQGQMGNPIFKEFSASIDKLNVGVSQQDESNIADEKSQQPKVDKSLEGDYEISRYGDGWSYKTFHNGEKIFIISNDLETLKKKIESKHLPLD